MSGTKLKANTVQAESQKERILDYGSSLEGGGVQSGGCSGGPGASLATTVALKVIWPRQAQVDYCDRYFLQSLACGGGGGAFFGESHEGKLGPAITSTLSVGSSCVATVGQPRHLFRAFADMVHAPSP